MKSKSQKSDRMHFNTRFLPGHFNVQPKGERRELFRASVQSVEIEVSSYCNRSCWFCPNSTYLRKDRNFMDDQIYEDIISALSEIKYSGVLSFSGYTEATHDRSFIDRIRHARQYLPDAHIFTCSNGDYLSSEYVSELAAAGMDQMFVSCYVDDRIRGSYSLTKALSAVSRLQRRLDLLLNYTVVEPHSVCAEAVNKAILLTISCRDHSVHANDRGKVIDVVRPDRYEPCAWVFSNVYIDYDGTMKPCANVRADIPAHAGFMYGQISAPDSLFELYGGDTATAWRRELVGFDRKSGPCARCIQGAIADTVENRERAEAFAVRPADLKVSSLPR